MIIKEIMNESNEERIRIPDAKMKIALISGNAIIAMNIKTMLITGIR
jgi:hypothetical protein